MRLSQEADKVRSAGEVDDAERNLEVKPEYREDAKTPHKSWKKEALNECGIVKKEGVSMESMSCGLIGGEHEFRWRDIIGWGGVWVGCVGVREQDHRGIGA